MQAEQATQSQTPQLTRQEWGLLGGEVAALFLIFIIAFTGRDEFGDQVKQLLTILSIVAGSAGAVAGGWVAWRGIASGAGRWQRLALGTVMIFLGGYTVIHVLS
jgi:hypothetical protein